MNDYTYYINKYHFGYYNEDANVDIIVSLYNENEDRIQLAREIVNREINNWGSCEDDKEHYYYEGYLESVMRELNKELLEVTIYDKVEED